MDRDRSSLPASPTSLALAGAYARYAASAAITMARYALCGRGDGVRNGARAFSLLRQEVAGAFTRKVGDACACTLCGWSGDRFGPIYYFDEFRENTICWSCSSTDRTRLLPLFYSNALGDFFASSKKRVLDVGGLANSRRFFPPNVDYVSFDLHASHAMVRGDLCAAPFDDGTFDFWVCFHVLDIIEDDERAMRELYRILAPGGCGLLDNAMNWDGPTEEYGRTRKDKALHRRRYGLDLLDRLRNIGFEVEIMDVEHIFDAETRGKYGIFPRRLLQCKKP